MMRTIYKNEIFNVIEKSEFTLGDFSLIKDDTKGFPLQVIKYQETPFQFIIRNSTTSFEQFQYKFVRYAPKYPITDYLPHNWTSFSVIKSAFSLWLKEHIKNYIDDQFVPDLWAEYQNGQKTLDFKNIDFDDKSSFSTIERKQVAFAINELKFLIEQNFKPTSEELILISARLDYLIESTKKLNKFDWKSLVLSTAIGIATTLTLDTEKGKLLFELFRKVFTTLHLLTP